jgi:sugar-specific transcriptional regulator TrmB
MTQQKVVDRLVALGMTTYEAKVFLALTRLGEARVSDINAVTDVPRPAIYETLDKLEQRGVIEVSMGRPKKFRALPPKTAINKIESELKEAVDEARCGLEELAGSTQRDPSDVRIWIVRGRTRTVQKISDLVDSTKKNLFVAGHPRMLLELEEVWRRAKARKVRVHFLTGERDEIKALGRYGRIEEPDFDVKKLGKQKHQVLFLRADGDTILFASEHGEEGQPEDLTAFWTDDENFVRFVNYVTEPMTKVKK